jgi:tRNA(fMet)-specific endonuclease VapC
MRFLLDTAVLSEPMRPEPRASVMEALEQYAGEFATASIVIHELQYGVARLAGGRRKSALSEYIDVLLDSDLQVLAYNTAAARWHALRRAELEREGRKLPFVDGQIAAVAATHGLTLVTPNRSDFEPFGIAIESW